MYRYSPDPSTFGDAAPASAGLHATLAGDFPTTAPALALRATFRRLRSAVAARSARRADGVNR